MAFSNASTPNLVNHVNRCKYVSTLSVHIPSTTSWMAELSGRNKGYSSQDKAKYHELFWA